MVNYLVEHWQELYEEAIENTKFWFIRASTWKRAAKKWRSLALLASLSWKTIIKQRDDAQALADRRRELLREILEMEACPFCWANQEQEHAANCQLAKELSDD